MSFVVVATRGIQYRSKPTMGSQVHDGPSLGARLNGTVVACEDSSGVDFLHVDASSDEVLQGKLARGVLKTDSESLYLPMRITKRGMHLVTDQKPDPFEVIAFQGVRLRHTPTYDNKADGAGPKMGVQVLGLVIQGDDGLEYLQIFNSGMFVPMTDRTKEIQVFSRVFQEDDIDDMCGEVWSELEVTMAGMTSPPGTTPTNKKAAESEDLAQEHAALTHQTEAARQQLDQAEAELAKLQECNRNLEAKVVDAKRRCEEAEDVSDKAGQVALDMQEELDEASEEVEELEESIAELELENQELRARLADH